MGCALTHDRAKPVTRAFKSQALILTVMLGLFWLVFAATMLTGGALFTFGIIPRTTLGLRGIFFAPFLHGSVNHIVANSIPFVILGWLVMLRDARHFVPVTFAAMIASGMTAWLLGAPGSVHIGASGVIFGYLGFLMLSGWFARSMGSILISVAVTLVWGSVVIGVLPGNAGISWQAHLGGFLGGVLAARHFRKR